MHANLLNWPLKEYLGNGIRLGRESKVLNLVLSQSIKPPPGVAFHQKEKKGGVFVFCVSRRQLSVLVIVPGYDYQAYTVYKSNTDLPGIYQGQTRGKCPRGKSASAN